MVALVFAGLMLTTVPDAKPDHTFVHAGVNYDVYVLEQGSNYSVQVCARYRLTGTRILRNSCKVPAAQEPAVMLPLKHDENKAATGPMLYKRRAEKAARVGNALINKNTEVAAFWKAVGKAIQEG
ncbi:MAG: hypothetical protein AAFQ82_07720 [Myxococcota bacterium]